MIIPNNGKVIVFDDKPDDVKDLLTTLSKERVPYLYYQDELAEDLPDAPVDNVRLVFLDLELVTNNPGAKNIIAPIASRLKKVLTPNNLYVLIYWSTKEDKYRKALEAEFENGLITYKPVKMLTLDKAKAKAEGQAYLKQSLKEEIKQFSSLNTFMLWEASVNQAAGSITNHICSIFEKNEKWDKNMYDMLLRLATAQTGRDVVGELNNNELLEYAFDVINTNLIETVEKKFKSAASGMEIGEIKEGGSGISEDEIVNLNTKIHLINSDKPLNHFVQGNLYIMKVNGLCREIIKKNVKQDKIKELKEETTKLICLDVTPSCDYSQAKNYSRMVYGLMVPASFIKKNFKEGPNWYNECPIMKFEESSYILLDFRCVRSFSNDEFRQRFPEKPIFRLRTNLVIDIQAQLANHINRPGIVKVI